MSDIHDHCLSADCDAADNILSDQRALAACQTELETVRGHAEADRTTFVTELSDLAKAFTNHREQTHKVQPTYCETCGDSTSALIRAYDFLNGVTGKWLAAAPPAPAISDAESLVRAAFPAIYDLDSRTGRTFSESREWLERARPLLPDSVCATCGRARCYSPHAAPPAPAAPQTGDPCAECVDPIKDMPTGSLCTRCHYERAFPAPAAEGE